MPWASMRVLLLEIIGLERERDVASGLAASSQGFPHHAVIARSGVAGSLIGSAGPLERCRMLRAP